MNLSGSDQVIVECPKEVLSRDNDTVHDGKDSQRENQQYIRHCLMLRPQIHVDQWIQHPPLTQTDWVYFRLLVVWIFTNEMECEVKLKLF